MYTTLSHYIARLEEAGELIRIPALVSAELEIAELTDRESKRPGGGRALLFEQSGTAFPVVTNMMGSDRRIAMALGVERLDELTRRIDELFASLTTPRPTLMEKLKILPMLEKMSRWLPRDRSGHPPCQEVIIRGDEVDLGLLPILKCWPWDGGAFVTLPLVNTLDPDTGVRNVGMYRMQVLSPTTTAMHWHLHKTGERHYRAYQRLGRRMPVSVCLGGDPAYTYAATAPMPDNMDEYLLAGFLRKKPVELVHCVTNEIKVPADCDFVIEGYVDPAQEKVVEGPFGDHTGFYSLEDLYPVFHLTAITHRRGAIYPATLVGIPPQEDAYIAKATEKIFLAPIRAMMLPEIRDLYMPPQGVAHNIAVVNIERYYPGQGLKTVNSLWGAGQMMFNKFMVVTATSEDIRQVDTLRQLLRRIDSAHQLVFSRGPLDVLDHAAPQMGLGGKLAFDLTEIDLSTPAEPITLPPQWELNSVVCAVDDTLAQSWSLLLLTISQPEAQQVGQPDTVQLDIPHWLECNGVRGVKFVVLLDEAVDSTRHSDVLWLAASNCDPSRDVILEQGVLILDARTKADGINGFDRPWPNIVSSSPETIRQVDERWSEYGLGDLIPSPSNDYLALQSGDSALLKR